MLLWVLMGLFCLRVLGQVLVEFLRVGFLPSSREWFSGLIPYPELLASQILIIALQAKIGLDFTRQSGWSYRPRHLAGLLLLPFGAIYLTAMIIRYVLRMGLYPHERWTGGSIPIFFHWVLALYVITVGVHHWRQSRPVQSTAPASLWRRLLRGGLQLAVWTLVASGLAAWVFYLLLPSVLAYELGIRRPEFAVRIERSVAMTTTDGISLVADIFHPQRAGEKTPTILVRIPYSKTFLISFLATTVGRMWAERGYTVVLQGTRGRYESGGDYYPLRGERKDGIDTLRWLAGQPWFDGRLGMWGGSYFGYTQWVIADCKEPGPTALMIYESSTDFYRMFHPDGAFSFKSALYWALLSHGTSDVAPKWEAIGADLAGLRSSRPTIVPSATSRFSMTGLDMKSAMSTGRRSMATIERAASRLPCSSWPAGTTRFCRVNWPTTREFAKQETRASPAKRGWLSAPGRTRPRPSFPAASSRGTFGSSALHPRSRGLTGTCSRRTFETPLACASTRSEPTPGATRTSGRLPGRISHPITCRRRPGELGCRTWLT